MRRVVIVATTAAMVAMAAFACDSFEEGDPGAGDSGSTADGNVPDSDVPDDSNPMVDAGPIVESFARIAAGDHTACAIRNDQVYCWGDNSFGAAGQGGQISCIAPDAGNGDAGDAGTCRPTGQLVSGLENKTVVEIAAGSHQACARTSEHEVYCWGANSFQRLGVDNTEVPTLSATPKLVKTLPPAYGISVGNGAACARVLVDGRMEGWCWGLDVDGELGRGLIAATDAGPYPSRAPGKIAWDAPIDDIVLGYYSGCARSGSEIRCWGMNANGALGHPLNSAGDVKCPYATVPVWCNPTPTNVPIETSFTKIAAVGAQYACAFEGTTPRCWGSNYNGMLGQGGPDPSDHAQPATPNSLTTALANAKVDLASIRARFSHACALDTAGAVWCWGSNVVHELGHGQGAMCGSVTCDGTAKKVPINAKIVEISPGYLYGLALDDAGQIWAWGTNVEGRLGHLPGSKFDTDCASVNEVVPAGKCNVMPRLVDFD